MDANKLTVLREIGYEIKRTCGTCASASFPQNDWGTCSRFTYHHSKHGDLRAMSINRYGTCSDHEMKDVEKYVLGAFEEFLR